MTSEVTYQGSLRTELLHLASGNQVITDAPVDNQGKGEAFSPTDLVATALASCMLTIMGIKARDIGKSMEGSIVQVNKVMASDPRRIAKVEVFLHLTGDWSDKEKVLLERAGRTCPVALSLHESIEQAIHFSWPNR